MIFRGLILELGESKVAQFIYKQPPQRSFLSSLIFIPRFLCQLPNFRYPGSVEFLNLWISTLECVLICYWVVLVSFTNIFSGIYIYIYIIWFGKPFQKACCISSSCFECWIPNDWIFNTISYGKPMTGIHRFESDFIAYWSPMMLNLLNNLRCFILCSCDWYLIFIIPLSYLCCHSPY